MKAKVGDKVRITHTDYSGTEGYEVGDIQHVVRVDDDGDAALGDYEWFFLSDEFELIPTDATISNTIAAIIAAIIGVFRK